MGTEFWKWVKDVLELLSFVATVAGVILAVFGYRFARRDQKEATAAEHYQGYLSLSVEYPKFARGGILENDSEFERYQWFVSVMLHASEEILLVTKNDSEWREAIRLQLGYHWRYLAGREFANERDVYDPLLAGLIHEVVSERLKSPATCSCPKVDDLLALHPQSPLLPLAPAPRSRGACPS